MAIQYSSGAPTVATSTPATRTAMVDFVKDNLITAGWSVISGSSGDWVVKTAVTAAGFSVRMRIWDPGSGNCARLALNNNTGTVVLDASAPVYLYPSGSTYKIIANEYQFFVFVESSTAARSFAAGGVPYVPSHLTSSFSDVVGWLTGNATTDGDTSEDASLRSQTVNATMNTGVNWQVIFDEVGVGSSGNDANRPCFIALVQGTNQGTAPQMINNDYLIYEPLLAMNDNTSLHSKVVGQLWDFAVSSQPAAVLDDEFSFDSRTFHVMGTSTASGDIMQHTYIVSITAAA
jgi:hypothetical protein